VIPVVLFAYRRADLLRRSLASLRANGVPMIYAFSDGPRDASVAADVEAVRAELRAVDWTRIAVIESPVNLGVSEAEQRGITRVLAEHDTVVIVEEDLEFVPGTYAFLCEALARYRDEPRVFGVTAWTHSRVTPPGVTQPYFTERMCALVWGTWRRAWEGMLDATALERRDECLAKGIDPAKGGRDLVESVIHEQMRGFWDLRFNLHMLARGGLFLYPAHTMVQHIGYDPRATNTPNVQGWDLEPSAAPALERIAWPAVEEYPGSTELWRLSVDGPPPPAARTALRSLKRRLARVADRLRTLAREFDGAVRGRPHGMALAWARFLLWTAPPDSTRPVAGFRLRIIDGPSAFHDAAEVFIRRRHRFAADRDDPVVIDVGAHVGCFALATRRDHPRARITAIEPDPAALPLLRQNLAANGAGDIRIVRAAVGGADGEAAFTSGGRAGGSLSEGGGYVRARVERLSGHVTEPVDFLKLDVAGAELDVLREVADAGKLGLVREMTVECHDWPSGTRRVDDVRALLESHGFACEVTAIDDEEIARTPESFPAPAPVARALVRARRH